MAVVPNRPCSAMAAGFGSHGSGRADLHGPKRSFLLVRGRRLAGEYAGVAVAHDQAGRFGRRGAAIDARSIDEPVARRRGGVTATLGHGGHQ